MKAPKKPAFPGEAFSTAKMPAPLYSPPLHTPCIIRKKIRRRGAPIPHFS